MSESATRWGALWGSEPDAWAVNEAQQTPVYEAALQAVGAPDRAKILDVGCGTGVFLRLCADRGAEVSGVDAAEGLLELARTRVPGAELQQADMVALPFADDTFDLVTGFTSFFFADDIVRALSEARRVARPGAAVVAEVFGHPDRCDLEAVKGAVTRFRDGEPEYWRPDAIESLLPHAGLELDHAFDVQCAYRYPDAAALGEAMLAAGGAGVVAGPERVDELRAAILDAVAHCRRPDGSYQLANEWHVVVARA
ncbi:class I SAM-dependent methyltransferase [Solirubrobacter phytolaccae]|uniref:Class I SAM-dependent methyltransferase n=1 Tax=Solirubrobacter phytolaccae TaxID=1404360 RepID=A0A9X3NEH0_9ACTN|nr:class I SAM-dependent methyltransferase [Solirubrobacter phytolaccae]MDA0185215.1 class I SAM-dependent methyltransferase [Solirubrobacter phytolaccae]